MLDINSLFVFFGNCAKVIKKIDKMHFFEYIFTPPMTILFPNLRL